MIIYFAGSLALRNKKLIRTNKKRKEIGILMSYFYCQNNEFEKYIKWESTIKKRMKNADNSE